MISTPVNQNMTNTKRKYFISVRQHTAASFSINVVHSREIQCNTFGDGSQTPQPKQLLEDCAIFV